MKILMKILLIALFLSHLGCKEEENDKIIESILYRIEIKNNNLIIKAYEYTAEGIQSEFHYTRGIIDNKIIYNRNIDETLLVKEYCNSEGIKKRIDSLFYNENGKVDYMIYYFYSEDNHNFNHFNHYQILDYNSNGQLIKHTDYDSTHNHFLTLTFEYDLNENISRKYYPLETGLPQDTLEYDNKTSIYNQLKLPEIDEYSISKNNINKITRRIQTYDGFDYSISEFELYHSIFHYENSGIPYKEIRFYSDNKTDTLTFERFEIRK